MRVELKLLITSLMIIFLTSTIFSQDSEYVATNTALGLTVYNENLDNVVAEFDGHVITLAEFEKAYAKNVGGVELASQDSLQDYKNFLDLYVTYKMKLRNAFVRDYRNDEELINELNEYKEQVGISYIEEKKIVVPGIRIFYDQRSEEVRVSHLMLKKDAKSVENLKKAEEILDSIKNGTSFESMVVKYSQDNFSKTLGGDIYWFTAGQIVPSFEFAAYETPVGEIYPKIVETKFGYHIIKITDKSKRRYKLRAKHILISLEATKKGNKSNTAPGETTLSKAIKIREEIINGANFDSLAIKYSDDPGSGEKGGDLGFFERRQMVKPFDEAVFKLEINEISEIVTTKFGYHIIQLVDEIDYPTFEKEVETLREMYKKSRYDHDYNRYIENLKDEFHYILNDDFIDKISADDVGIKLTPDYVDDQLYISNKDEVIIKLNQKSFTLENLFAFLDTQTKYNQKELTKRLLNSGVREYGIQILLSEKAAGLEKSDQEFKSLMNDYKNGIYIFKLQEDEIWNMVKIDSAKLKENYSKSKDNFVVKARVNFSEIFTKDEGKIYTYYQMLLDGITYDSVAIKYTERNSFKAKAGLHGWKDYDDSGLSQEANSLNKVGDLSEPFAVDNGWAIVRLNEKIAQRTKTFEEVLPELSSSFQESESKRLEDKYINGLKTFYKPEYNYDELENAFKGVE